jgi:hypothetical protein
MSGIVYIQHKRHTIDDKLVRAERVTHGPELDGMVGWWLIPSLSPTGTVGEKVMVRLPSVSTALNRVVTLTPVCGSTASRAVDRAEARSTRTCGRRGNERNQAGVGAGGGREGEG